MISMTSKGRGYSAALDVGSDNTITYQNMTIIRPMKDMLAKEIAVYNRNHNIDGFVIPTTNWSTKATSKSSIERLTEGTGYSQLRGDMDRYFL
jgi:cytoplasmic tRNA 2-thiolation protein 2